uniref:Proteasome assembly chaperone 4 n=1 Tax=Catagonus wagneri TaxID=51154 RepID=A0A8C3YW44_9CETA
MEPRCHPRAGTVSLNSFSASLREQIVHFHVTRLMDSLYLWAGATPHLRDLAVAMRRPANRCFSVLTFRTQTVAAQYL